MLSSRVLFGSWVSGSVTSSQRGNVVLRMVFRPLFSSDGDLSDTLDYLPLPHAQMPREAVEGCLCQIKMRLDAAGYIERQTRWCHPSSFRYDALERGVVPASSEQAAETVKNMLVGKTGWLSCDSNEAQARPARAGWFTLRSLPPEDVSRQVRGLFPGDHGGNLGLLQ